MRQDENLGVLIANFLSSLRRLAASPEEQIAYLSQLGVGDCADELALEFDDDFQPIKHRVSQWNLNQSQADAIVAVDKQLGKMSGPEKGDLWTFAALRTAPEWNEVRRLAGTALELLPSDRGPAGSSRE